MPAETVSGIAIMKHWYIHALLCTRHTVMFLGQTFSNSTARSIAIYSNNADSNWGNCM
jgi:hypothetical protein